MAFSSLPLLFFALAGSVVASSVRIASAHMRGVQRMVHRVSHRAPGPLPERFRFRTRQYSSGQNGPVDMAALMNDPKISAQYKEAMQNPQIQKMLNDQMKILQNPDFLRKMEEMKNDPEMAPIFAELESGGMEAMMKYYNDPVFVEKLTSKMGDISDFMTGPAAGAPPAGAMPGATPGAGLPGFDQMMSDPDMMSKFKALSDDPELKPFLEKIKNGGPEAMQQAMSDPSLLQKFDAKMKQIGLDQEKIAKIAADAANAPATPYSASPPAVAAGPEIETLLDAARYGDTEAAEDLCYVGKDVNLRDGEMRTPIHWACAGGHTEIAKILIDNGADLTALDSKGNSPLHYATGYGQPAAAALLLDAGVDVSVTNNNGKTSKDVVTLNPQNPISKEAAIMARL